MLDGIRESGLDEKGLTNELAASRCFRYRYFLITGPLKSDFIFDLCHNILTTNEVLSKIDNTMTTIHQLKTN